MDDVFDTKYYVGGTVGLDYANVNSPFMPTRGVKFNTSVGVIAEIEGTGKTHYPIKAELTFYQNLDPRNNFLFATRIGTQHNIGDFEFFQAAVIGGKTNLRGYRSERFSGRTSFYHNLDLRIKEANECQNGNFGQ